MKRDEFIRLASQFNVVPLTRTLLADMQTPVSAYLSLRQTSRSSFLFESVEPNERIGRFSFIGTDPVVLIRGQGTTCEVTDEKGPRDVSGTIFDVLASYSSQYRQAPVDGFEGLFGGFVGYLGYDAVRHLERLPGIVPARGRERESIFGLFDDIVRFDHFRQSLTIVHNVLVDPGRDVGVQYDEGLSRLDTMELRLRRPAVATSRLSLMSQIRDLTTKEEFCEAVTRAKRHIVEGDIFQVVLSRRMEARFHRGSFPGVQGIARHQPVAVLVLPGVWQHRTDRIVSRGPCARSSTGGRGSSDCRDASTGEERRRRRPTRT